jgi:hypothetical protein
MRVLRALIKSRSGQIGESWREVPLTGLQTGYFRAPRPFPVYAFGYWFGAINYSTGGNNYLRIVRSADGIAWEFVADVFTAATVPENFAATFNDGTLLFGGRAGVFQGYAAMSQDGTNWNGAATAAASQINSVAFENDVFLASSSGNGLRRSTDFATWATVSSTVTNVAGANNIFVGMDAGLLANSTDGLTWSSVSALAGKSIGNVSFAGGRFWATTLDVARQLWWSTDGSNWFQATVPPAFQNDSNPVYTMGYAAGLWFYAYMKQSAPSTTGAMISSTGNVFQDVSGTNPNQREISFNGPFLFTPYGFNPQTAYVSP